MHQDAFKKLVLLLVFVFCFSVGTQSWADEVSTATVSELANNNQSIDPPQLKPITISFPGTVTKLSLASAKPSVTVQDRYGIDKRMQITEKTKISHKEKAGSASDLTVGQSVTVEYVYDVANGERFAASIDIHSEQS